MRVLVPVDLGAESAALVRYAAGLCGRGEGAFIIFHVYDHKADVLAASHDADWIDPHVERLRTELNYLRAQAGACGQRARVEVVHGEPVGMILTRARELRPDVIVMGTHRRVGLSRVLVGSVAEGVLRGAHRPVLLIPVSLLTSKSEEDLAVKASPLYDRL